MVHFDSVNNGIRIKNYSRRKEIEKFEKEESTMILPIFRNSLCAQESFTIAVAFIYSYRISLFHPIRIVSDSEPVK